MTLLARTRLLLEHTHLSLRVIAEGSGVGYEWLRKFKADLIEDPSVRRVQDLHDFLTEHKSNVA